MSEKAAKKKAPAKKAASKKTAKPKKEEKPNVEKAETAVEKVKLKPTPQPWVLARHGISMHQRPARGYSFGELEAAEIELGAAKSFSVPIDVRRRSVVEENAEKLREWYKPARKLTAERPKTEKTEKAKPKKKAAKQET